MNEQRCDWPTGNQLLIDYHDNEWGEPVHDDRKHFEFMVNDHLVHCYRYKQLLK